MLLVDMITISIGVLLLTMGQRLFWLFVACLGFVAGLEMAQLYLGLQPAWMVWLAGLLCGAVGAVLAIFFQGLAIGLGGFAAGSTISAHIAGLVGLAAGPIISFAGGIAGMILLFAAFDWALIGLSSVAGSTLIVQSLNAASEVKLVLYAVLIAVGIIFQVTMMRRQQPEAR